jgi:Cof subfamily protein (haloacid dehalogenase superfamily)
MSTPAPRRLFAMDLDGTLLDREDGIHPRDALAISAALEQGIMVTIATGRLTSRTHPTARRLKLDAPLICADGGVRACSVTERVLSRRPMSPAVTQHVLELLGDTELSSFVFTHEAIHSCQRGVAYHPFVRGWSHSIVTHADIRAASGQHVAEGAIMLVGMGDASAVDVLHAQVAALGVGLELLSFDLGGARVLRLMAEGTSKGAALRELSAELGVAPEHVAVIGDWYNDLSMFEVAAHAYAMPHAPRELMALASHVLDAEAPARGAIADALAHWQNALS